jgi:hypothetical protein
MKRHNALLLSLTLALTVPAQAAMITQWDFNSQPADGSVNTGVLTPSAGAGSATLVGGASLAYATGSPGDTSSPTDNSGLNASAFPLQGAASGSAGVQFAVSTFGAAGQVQVALDFRQSPAASRYFQLLASADGTNFSPVSGGTATVNGPIGLGNTLTAFGNDGVYVNNCGPSPTFVEGLTYTFPAGSPFENNPNFAFRFVSIFDPTGFNGGNYISSNAGTTAAYNPGGTGRFDLVTVSTVAEPSSGVLAGCVLLAGAAARRLRRRRGRTGERAGR